MLVRHRRRPDGQARVQPQDAPAGERHVRTQPGQRDDRQAQLLAAFAHQRLLRRFAGLDRPARELPPAGQRRRVGAGGDEHRVAAADSGGHDDASPNRPTHSRQSIVSDPPLRPTTANPCRSYNPAA